MPQDPGTTEPEGKPDEIRSIPDIGAECPVSEAKLPSRRLRRNHDDGSDLQNFFEIFLQEDFPMSHRKSW